MTIQGRHPTVRRQHTYEAIFRHPADDNWEWRDVQSLLAALADVAEGHNVDEPSLILKTEEMHWPESADRR